MNGSGSRHTRLKRDVTRRTVLRLIAGGAGLVAAGKRFRPATSHAATAGSTLVVGSVFVVVSVDPGRTIDQTAYMIDHSTYDTLITFDGEDVKTPKPSLATNWKVSDDGRGYTFALRPNVRFTSGNLLTSADVKWSFDRLRNLKSNPAFLLNNMEEVQTPDPLTVTLRLKAPEPSIIPILASPSLSVLDSKVVSDNGGRAGPDAKETDKAEAYLSAHSAGTGPFILASYVPNQEFVLVKNPHYWRGAPKLERVVVRNILEPATEALQLAKGDLDIATGLSQDQLPGLQKLPSVSAKVSPAAVISFVLMNQSPDVGGPFANPKVQQAVRYALDYKGILAIIGQGAVPLAGLMPTTFPGALDPREAVKTDRGRAKTLLHDSGISDVSGHLLFYSDATSYGVHESLLVQKIQEDLAAVGIRITLSGLPSSMAAQQLRSGKCQIGVFLWIADYPDASDYLVFLPGGVVGKRANWSPDSSPAAQELVKLGDAVRAEGDPRRRVALYQRVERGLDEVGPFVPLFQPSVPYAFRSNLRGVTFHSVWGVDFYAVSKPG